MATIRKQASIRADAAAMWDAFADFAAVHTRLAPGFVTHTRLDGADRRIVTFANGTIATERLVTMDGQARRLAYTVLGVHIEHHSASFELIPEAGGTRLVWTADVLPEALAERIGAMMEHGMSAMKAHFEASAPA